VTQTHGTAAETTIAVGSDERTPLTDALLDELAARGFAILTFGAIDDGTADWPAIGRRVAQEVSAGRARFGIVCCWTGTGVSIAANKVAGVRAALCGEAQTARGARRWNDANVLALSLRATAVAVALEIVAAFLEEPASAEPADRRAIAALEP
jgi:ribose 5-phosphate isomerase B